MIEALGETVMSVSVRTFSLFQVLMIVVAGVPYARRVISVEDSRPYATFMIALFCGVLIIANTLAGVACLFAAPVVDSWPYVAAMALGTGVLGYQTAYMVYAVHRLR